MIYTITTQFNRFCIYCILCIGCWSCNKSDDAILFKMEYDTFISLPGGLNTVETYSFLLRDLPTNYMTLLQTYALSDAAIVSINPGSIRLTDELNQLDFSRVEKISLLASDVMFRNELEIAYLEIVPFTSSNTLQLFPTLVNAKALMTQEKFNLKLKVKLRSFLTSSSNIRLRLNLNANP